MSKDDEKPEVVAPEGGSVEIFKVESRFARLAKRSGGIDLKQAVDAGQQAIDKMAEAYPDWLASDLETLVSQVGELATGDADSANEAVYRTAMSIRDLGSTFGYFLVTQSGDLLCELLVRKRRAGNVDATDIQPFIDAIRLVATPRFKGIEAGESRGLLDGLRQIIARYPGPTVARKTD
ncbi:MAG: hypothetical protein HQ481_03400 [Alphaproteobacteria bacterium]|nr:hypothetical protein [Alphaproteobacteria bacterium]